jgi:hypothetical protein
MEKARAHQRSSRKNERARGERNTIDEVDLSACAMGLNVPFSAPLLRIPSRRQRPRGGARGEITSP